MTDTPSATMDSAARHGLSRRTIIAGAAWSVPAIVSVTATPAFAVSGVPTLTVTSPRMQAAAAGTTPVSTRITDDSGQPVPGRAVTLTGPSGTSFSPETPTTDVDGIATTTMTTTDPWALPGSSLTVTATSTDTTATAALTLLGANAYAVGYNWAGQLGTPVDGNTEAVPTPAQLSLVFPSPIRSLSAGSNFSIALLDDGTVWAIGDNTYGALGDGTRVSRESWAEVPGLSGVLQIAVSASTAYALLADRTVSAWGSNTDGTAITGQLGTANVTFTPTPTTVPGVTGATQIAAGESNGYALLTDGRIRAWGKNHLGQIGNGFDDEYVNLATTVLDITGATQIAAAGSTAYALISGNVYGWGYGEEGQLTDTTSDGSNPTPRRLTGISGATAIAAGGSTGYALVGGQVKSWGRGDKGQLGNNSTTDSATVVTVADLTEVTMITATRYSAYAISPSGLFAWGGNDNGQLGDGSYATRTTPVTVQNTAGVTALMPPSNVGSSSAFFLRHQLPALTVTSPDMRTIAAGTTPVTAVLTDSVGNPARGTLVTWSGPSGTSFSPATATTDATGTVSTTLTTTDTWATPGSTIDVVASGGGLTTTAALTVLGANAYGLGYNSDGCLGTPASTPVVAVPTQLSLVFPSPIRSMTTDTYDRFEDGYAWSFALLQDGTVWGIGLNSRGQLGDGTTTSRSTWTEIPHLTGVSKVVTAHFTQTSYALLDDGTVWAWGGNTQGQLGNGTTSDSPSPTPAIVPNLTGVVDISAGAEYVLALMDGGEVRAWGANNYGEIPTGNTSTPVVIAGIAGATRIAASGYTAYAVAGNQVYAWGEGSWGQLGNGTNAASTTAPVLVSNLTNVDQLAKAWTSAFALTGGTVRAWGQGGSGQLGNGSGGDSNLPVTVNGLTGVTKITAGGGTAYALSSAGVSSWGMNLYSQLGDGTRSNRAVPGSVNGMENVTGLSDNGTNAMNVFFLR